LFEVYHDASRGLLATFDRLAALPQAATLRGAGTVPSIPALPAVS
jgi:hypothetical protein